MSQGPAGEKTEKATPRRRKQAKEEGQVSKSADLNSGIILAVAFAVFMFIGQSMFNNLRVILRSNLSTLDISNINMTHFTSFLFHYTIEIVLLVAPLLSILVLVGIIANISQVGPLFTTKPLKPKPEKINPISGFKNKFSMKGLVELIKGILKVAIIGGVGYFTIYPRRDDLIAMSGTDLVTSLTVIYDIIFSLSWKVCIILIILGLLDYIYQKYEFEKSIKMTKQEIKDEFKNTEGNPEIKRKVKSIQIQMASKRMMTKIPEADVVVTNPTHFAIAIKYNPDEAPAPIVIAKGVDAVAMRIKEKAKEHGIPIVENKPLARSLYKLVDLGRMVPPDLFIAVAEVLAYIYKKNKGKKKRKFKIK